MAAQDDDQQEINSPEETTYYDCEDDEHEHEDLVPKSKVPKSIWEELHELLEDLVSKLHLDNLLQEKPDDPEDKTAISRWLDKLINLVITSDQQVETLSYSSRGLDDPSKNDAVAKLERFKVKNLATTASTTVNNDKK